jgi:SAM-dependent methyltransferase
MTVSRLPEPSPGPGPGSSPGPASGPGLRPELAASFQYAGVAHAYRFRPPYPAEVFDVLEGLLRDEPAHVLDLGAGEGALARPLITRGRVARVDAVDASAAMIAAGRERPGGGHPGLSWLHGVADEVALEGGPYGLAVAGASLHWMPWQRIMARLREVLSADGLLAIVEHGYHRLPWGDEVAAVIARHSRNPDFDPRFDMADELVARGLFRRIGEHRTLPLAFQQTVADYIEQFHSTASLARELMPVDEAAAFDEAVAQIVRRNAHDGVLTMDVVATIVWGEPMTPDEARA